MYSVHIDKKHNQLILTFADQVDVQEGEKMYAEIREAIPLLTTNFDVISDLSRLEHMDSQVRNSIERSMDLLGKSGISRTIRIIPDSGKDIGFNIMSLFHYPSSVIIHTFKSRKEAEDYLKKK